VRKTKEVLRLRFEVGLGLRQIARSCSIGLGTVHEYLQRAEAAGITWPLGEDWDEDRLEAALFGGPPRARPAALPMPDFAELHQQRQLHPQLTQQLLWEEYRQANPDGYRYSRFCELFKRWRRKQDMVLRQEHKAAEKLFVDWAGTTIPIHDARGGPVQEAHLFVAVLGASSYTYAEATRDEQLASWIGAHVRAFEFYQGVTKLVVPDNTKTGVTKACRYDPDLNPTYQEMAMHYGVGVVPARPYKPRDKAKVESGVQLVERWIIAALRHRGAEPSHPRTARPHQPAAVPQARRFAGIAVHGSRQACAKSSARRTVRSQPVVPRKSEHRLSHCVRCQLLQRSLQPGARAGGSALDAHDGRAFPQGPAGGVTPACAWSRAYRHHCRAPSTFPPGASGMDTLAHGALGTVHWSVHIAPF
jgi:transposase